MKVSETVPPWPRDYDSSPEIKRNKSLCAQKRMTGQLPMQSK